MRRYLSLPPSMHRRWTDERGGIECRRRPHPLPKRPLPACSRCMARTRVKLSAPAGLCNIEFWKNILEKDVEATYNCISIAPLNVLGNIQKEILKLLPSVMCQSHMKLSFCKKLVGEAMSILQQPRMELFKVSFCKLPGTLIGVI